MTTDGLLPAETFAALWRARAAGLRVVPVTGRPAGWCDHIARMWPVDGVIGENGAFYFRKTSSGIHRVHVQTPAERAANRLKLEELRQTILQEVPGCGIASDQAYREYDLAVDFCEDVPPSPGTRSTASSPSSSATAPSPKSAPSTSTAGSAPSINSP